MSLKTSAQLNALVDLRSALVRARAVGLLEQVEKECRQPETVQEFAEATSKLLRRHTTPTR